MPTLEKIDCHLDGIGHALGDNQLSVPKYQRSYAWEDKQITQLFQDIDAAISAGEQEYFLGSIVVIRNASQARLDVVDGQQRLATTTILLGAIRDYFFAHNDQDRAVQLESKYLITRNLRTQEMIERLALNNDDNDFFRKRVLTRPDDQSRKEKPSREAHERIQRAAELAREQVNSLATRAADATEILLDWIEYVADRVRVIWVVVPDFANAFTIFETLNDRGLALALSDLLKNFLFSRAGDRLSEVQQKWLSMVSVLEAAEDEGVVVPYIRHLWSSKYGLTREKEVYEKVRHQVTTKAQALEFAGELLNGAELYAALLNPSQERWAEYGQEACSHMETLNMLGMAQMRPLLLAILSTFHAKEIQMSLRLAVDWAVRFLVQGTTGSGTLETQYAMRAVEIRKKAIGSNRELHKAMLPYIPSDAEFEKAFAEAWPNRV